MIVTKEQPKFLKIMIDKLHLMSESLVELKLLIQRKLTTLWQGLNQKSQMMTAPKNTGKKAPL